MKSAFILIVTLLFWNTFFRLIILTVLTYFMSHGGASFHDIVEATASNRISFAGLSVILLTILLIQPNPLISISQNEIIHWQRTENHFLPAFIRGGILGCFFVLMGLALGHYQYFGIFVQTDVSLWSLFNIVFRTFCLLAMIWLHEFYFRQKLFELFRNNIDPLRMILLCALTYTLMQSFQFQIGLAHQLTLTLISIALGFRVLSHKDFGWGVGLYFGFLTIIHVVFSLPILGNESQGLIAIKYNYKTEIDNPWMRLVTGGAGGPLASLMLQITLFIDIVIQYDIFKKRNPKNVFGQAPADR